MTTTTDTTTTTHTPLTLSMVNGSTDTELQELITQRAQQYNELADSYRALKLAFDSLVAKTPHSSEPTWHKFIAEVQSRLASEHSNVKDIAQLDEETLMECLVEMIASTAANDDLPEPFKKLREFRVAHAYLIHVYETVTATDKSEVTEQAKVTPGMVSAALSKNLGMEIDVDPNGQDIEEVEDEDF